MFSRDTWVEIFQTISKNKLRTFLSGFTVALGIFIFVVLFGFGNGLKNDLEFSEKIADVDKNLIIHKVVTSQGLLTFKKYSSGVLIKGVTENFFLERNILTKSISKDFIQDFKKNKGIFVGEKLKKKLDPFSTELRAQFWGAKRRPKIALSHLKKT